MNRYQHILKPYKRNFLLATALFLLLSTAFSFQERERRFLQMEKKQRDLIHAKEVLSRIQNATQDRRSALATIKSQFTEDTQKITAARKIYSLVDEIKTRYKPDDMVIDAIEKKGEDVSLNYTLSFSNTDYSALLNSIGQLQRNVFPFTPVESVAISQKEIEGRGVVLNVIKGRIITFEGIKP
ncbi:MAG: hypothetical protein PHD54_03865 [Desulfuromonadaceae bacterium]|nr:hypothetical protein [Desulfuromonadaceae bacterium]